MKARLILMAVTAALVVAAIVPFASWADGH
jgi:hypothetical protein